MNKLILLATTLTVVIGQITFGPGYVSHAEPSCLVWDSQARPAAAGPPRVGLPVIDRLQSDQPHGQLLRQWMADDCMRLNYVQVLGTHNSYHIQPRAGILAFIRSLAPFLPPGVADSFAASLEYTHRPLDEQLEVFGVRQIELDVYADPDARFSTPLGALFPGNPPSSELLSPGLKVLHTPDVDFETRCVTLIACLEIVKAWSESNPGHLPVLILIEAKDDPLPFAIPPGLLPADPVALVPFGADELDEIDATIRSVFSSGDLITPDDVRGSRTTLEEAILNDGWPTLNESRGRVMFALDNEDEQRDTYIEGHSSLAGRVMFTNSPPGTPESAFLEVDEPVNNVAYIQQLVKQGYLVRTRADADTFEARFNLTARREAALASGAQFISSDYPEPDLQLSNYFVEINSGADFRCNPVLSPPECTTEGLEAGVLP